MKKTILLLVFLLAINIANAQEEALLCETAPSPQTMWDLYSELYKGESDEVKIEKALEGVRDWIVKNPSSGSIINMVSYEADLRIIASGRTPTTSRSTCSSPEDDIHTELVTSSIIGEDGSILDKSGFISTINSRFDIELDISGGISNCKYLSCELSCESTSIIVPNLEGRVQFVPDVWINDGGKGVFVQESGAEEIDLDGQPTIYDTVVYDGDSVTFFDRVQDSENRLLFVTEYSVPIEFEDGFVSKQRIRVDVSKRGDEITSTIWRRSTGMPVLDKREVDDRLFTVENNMRVSYVNRETLEEIDATPSNEEILDTLVEGYSEFFENLIMTTKQEINPFVAELSERPVIYYYSRQLVGGVGGAEGETAILVSPSVFDELFSSIDFTSIGSEEEVRTAANELMIDKPVKVVVRGDLLRVARVWPIKAGVLSIVKWQTRKVLREEFELDQSPEWDDLDEMIDLANTPIMIIIERDGSGLNTLKLYDKDDILLKTVAMSGNTLDGFFEIVMSSEGMLGLRDRLIVQYLTGHDGTA
ncbi:MAG: hypothetical protein CMH62_00120 [Nanoarchaeota archaeon]|nr:hypothetical protein [Nanoarchaeota archaeon]|tara:strand:+ start:1657 stop:3255 length:1599 start_codon:yes stop_codon:yes gene_type:complete